MNFLNEIIEKKDFTPGKLYLLQKVSNEYGFFYQDGVVYFAKKSIPGLSGCSVSTAYLDMCYAVPIVCESANASFETGDYDMLAYKDNLESPEFDVFYNVCVTYANDDGDLNFFDFFNALIELFKKAEGGDSNLIGVFGELSLIKYMFDQYEVDISNNWHLTGTNSKFDFSFPKFNLEVKTTTNNELTFLLKHSQIFNNQKNYIAVVSLLETGSDKSLDDLVRYFANTEPFKNNVKFQIAVENEYLKAKTAKAKKRSFAVDSILIFDCAKMETIGFVPGCISDVQYRYNFSDLEAVDPKDLFD